MGNFYPTLGGKTLAELPKVPTALNTTGTTSVINASWTNNNTLGGTTNVLQVWNTTLGKWVDNSSVASGTTTGSVTGLTIPTTYNIRVAVKKTNTGRYYPSLVKTGELYSPYPLNGLLGRWSFDNSNLDDNSGNGYTLSTDATPTYVAGKVSNCLKIIDSKKTYSENAAILTAMGDTNPYSISLWWYFTNVGTYTYLFGFNGGTLGDSKANLYFTNNVFRYVNRGGSKGSNISWGGNLVNNTWYMFTITFDGNQTIIYKNATNVLTYSETTSLGTLTRFRIGAGGGDGYEVRHDNCYLYNRALTPAEVTQIYNGGAGI